MALYEINPNAMRGSGTYYMGRAGIEAKSMGIAVDEGEVVFRCNLVAVRDGIMLDYSAGHISTEEAEAQGQEQAAII